MKPMKAHNDMMEKGQKLLEDPTIHQGMKRLIKKEMENARLLIEAFKPITYRKFYLPDNLGDRITIYKCFLNGGCVGKISRGSSRHPWECEFKGAALGQFFGTLKGAKDALEEKIKLA